MTWSRREFVVALGAAGLDAAAPFSTGTAEFRTLLGELKRSSFGVESGRAKDRESLYRPGTPGQAPLSFDVSNHVIAASFGQNGSVLRMATAHGVERLPYEKLQGGVYTRRLMRLRTPKAIPVSLNGTPINANPATRIDLIENLFPLFSWETGRLSLTQLVFAPETGPGAADARPVVRVIFLVVNRSGDTIFVGIGGEAPAALRAGAERMFDLSISIDDTVDNKPAVFDEFKQTLQYHTVHQGRLDIPGAQWFADMIPRYKETARQSLLLTREGQFCGGFLGSNVDERDLTWNRDTFYAVLVAGLFEPRLIAAAIPFFMQYNLPDRPTQRGLDRFPRGARVTQSLGNAVAPLALAATYYRFTADSAYLRSLDLLPYAALLIDEIAATRRGSPMLFPSMFISNGDARGHFHTGSNVLAWYAISGMSRLTAEVYGDHSIAEKWSSIASRMRSDILAWCTGEGAAGKQFFEGVFDDHIYVPGHDGEESDTNLMAFYGFCSASEPLLRRHARLALTPLNPYFAPGPKGIWWHNHGEFRPATAPGWVTALTAAGTPRELLAGLDRLRALTDLDGSLWWWPYRYGETDWREVTRGNGAGKCAWASAVFVLRFIHDILGLDIDVPVRKLTIRPFLPWASLSWTGLPLGKARFDVRFDKGEIHIANRSRDAYHVRVESGQTAAGKTLAPHAAERFRY